MNDQKSLALPRWLGALGAWLGAALVIEIFVVVLVVLPRQAGLSMGSPDSLYADPAVFFPFLRDHPLLWRCLEPDLAYALSGFLLTWGLWRFLKEQAAYLSQLAVFAGMVGAGLFLIAGMIETVALPELAKPYAEHPEVGGAAFHAVQAMLTAVAWGGFFAEGWSTLLFSIAGLRTRRLPRWLCYLGMLSGLASILHFAVQPLGPVQPLLGIVMFIWLGIVLVRAR